MCDGLEGDETPAKKPGRRETVIQNTGAQRSAAMELIRCGWEYGLRVQGDPRLLGDRMDNNVWG